MRWPNSVKFLRTAYPSHKDGEDELKKTMYHEANVERKRRLKATRKDKGKKISEDWPNKA